MKVEVSYFDGCPTRGTAEKIMTEVLAGADNEADAELVAVETDENRSTASRVPGAYDPRARRGFVPGPGPGRLGAGLQDVPDPGRP